MKKLLILTSLLSLNALAQNLPMDNLIVLTPQNYCYNSSKSDFRNIIDYFSMNEKSVPVVAGFLSKAISINYPTIKVKKSGLDTAKELFKEDPKKYTEQDLTANPIQNIYTITNSIDLWFEEPAGVLANRISNQYNGIVFKQDGLGGGYTFALRETLKLKEAKDIKQYNAEHEKFVEGNMSFNIATVKEGEFKGGSVLSYQCVVNMATPLSAQDISSRLKGKLQ
jgi:hypothetical protein